jgi:hypothetical protein
MSPLEEAAIAYEAERRRWRIRYDHDSKQSIVFRENEELARYGNGGAALFTLDATARVESMRAALMSLAQHPDLPEGAVRMVLGKLAREEE